MFLGTSNVYIFLHDQLKLLVKFNIKITDNCFNFNGRLIFSCFWSLLHDSTGQLLNASHIYSSYNDVLRGYPG